jgi:hypothetical protein
MMGNGETTFLSPQVILEFLWIFCYIPTVDDRVVG